MNNAWPVIAKLARDLGHSHGAILTAKCRGRVPDHWRLDLLDLARKRRLHLTRRDLGRPRKPR